MRVKMIKIECGPGGNFQPGDERDVDPAHGRQLVASGAACAVECAAIAPQETASVSAPERAVGAQVETRKKARK